MSLNIVIIPMKSIGKPKPNKSESVLQASTHSTLSETSTKAKRGFKQPPTDELKQIICLVNLLPVDGPKQIKTEEELRKLPAELRAYLESVYEQFEPLRYLPGGPWHIMALKYEELVFARAALNLLILQANSPFSFPPMGVAAAYLAISESRKVIVNLSSFARAIEQAEIDYLRYCEMCRKIFYAGRKNQPCCTPKCAKAQRQKRWRQKYSEGQPAYYK